MKCSASLASTETGRGFAGLSPGIVIALSGAKIEHSIMGQQI